MIYVNGLTQCLTHCYLFFKIFIYLAVPGFSCAIWSFVVFFFLFVEACRI